MREVILFTKPSTCAPCRAFKPHWEAAQEHVSDAKFTVVDLDEQPEAVVEYDLQAVPTVRLYTDDDVVDIKARRTADLIAELS